MSEGDELTLDQSHPGASFIAGMEVVGTTPITYNVGGNRRQSYRDWVAALDEAAQEAAKGARPSVGSGYSVRMELRLYSPYGQGSDLDNYVKPIQDALAEHGVFGPVEHGGSSMKGDERIDHLDLRRKLVGSSSEAGVLAEVWAMDP